MLAAGLLALPSVSDTAGVWLADSPAASVLPSSFTEAASHHHRHRHRHHHHHHHRTAPATTTAPSTTASGTSGGSSTSESSSTSSGSSSSASGSSTSASGSSTSASGSTSTSSGSATSSSSATSTSTSRPSSPAGGSANGPFIPYGPNSYLQRRLPATTPISPDNARLVDFAKTANPDAYLKIRGAHGVGWGIAYAEADCSDPIYKIGAGGTVPPGQEHLRTVGFHAP